MDSSFLPLSQHASSLDLAALAACGCVEAASSPITVYASDAASTGGTQIASHGVHVAYGLKGGQLRVLSLASGAKALLRGHSKPLVDASFAPGNELLLATAAGDGLLLVRRLSEARAPRRVLRAQSRAHVTALSTAPGGRRDHGRHGVAHQRAGGASRSNRARPAAHLSPRSCPRG